MHHNITEYNEIMYTMNWIPIFLNHPAFIGKRFKVLSNGLSGFPPIDLLPGMYDVVDLEEYCAIEEDRLPLMVGCQFGVYPKVGKAPEFFNGEKLIAVLGKSVTSGNVSGLRIFKIPGRQDLWDECHLGMYELYSF